MIIKRHIRPILNKTKYYFRFTKTDLTMKNHVTGPKPAQIIIAYIRRLRAAKEISSKTMAYRIGMKPAEYSKLEGGHKLNWEKWLPKIAYVLEMDTLDLMVTENVKTYKTDFTSSEFIKILMEQKEENYRIFKIVEEDKDKLIAVYNTDAENWKAKYYRIKARLIEAEQRIEEYMNKISSSENNGAYETGSSLGTVGGGLINKFKVNYFLLY